MRVADVAVLLPVAGTYTYALPDGWELATGARVWVPFGRRSVEGVVVLTRELDARGLEDAARLKRVARRIDAPPLGDELLELARWVSSYYLAPIGEALRLCLPPGGRATEARRIQLTPDGAAAAAGLGAALEPVGLAGLGLRERAVLEALVAAGAEHDGGVKLQSITSAIDGARAALAILEARALVRRVSTVKARQERHETLVSALPASDATLAEAHPLLARAPRRLALYRAVLDGGLDGGEVPLARLRALDPRALDHVRALVDGGLLATREVTADRAPDAFAAPVAVAAQVPPPLHAAQLRAHALVEPALGAGRYAPFLLHGVTGSGKTEVYLHAIASALARGRGALVVVPEIALTPQLAQRFRARFGDQVAVLHSGLGDAERFAAWSRLADGRLRIALGARSAVFAPVAQLGIVVVDEEHDPSFKQEEGVRYHGRDVALVRARRAGAVALLGSATPSLELYEAAREGRMTLLEMPERATPRPLPTVEVVDLRQHKTGPDGLLSAPLVDALGETLAAREQAILFLNRRGFATFILCRACGHRFACPDCSIALTYHLASNRLACHYCGHLEPAPSRCPKCQAQAVERLGLGTEKVAAIVAEKFPTARVARLDRDTAQGRGIERVLGRVAAGEVDVVVGTQMITKGHDFPSVTLVGVVLADQSMHFPDFRAAERTFQLLAQVAGRAGRGERPGRVVVQTFVPEHAAIACARDHDYRRFFDAERVEREEHGYPPFGRLALVRVDGEKPEEVIAAAQQVGTAVKEASRALPESAGVRLRGPSEAPIAKLKGRTRWHLLVRAAEPAQIKALCHAAAAAPVAPSVRVSLDVDPVSTL